VSARVHASASRATSRLVNVGGALPDAVISRAVGEELRRAREVLGWSRLQLVERLPSGIGDRTLLSYEHGTRHLTVLRFVEISRELITDAPTLLSRGLQRARVYVENLTLSVDLRALLHDGSDTFRPMVQWARNALNEHPDGIAYVEPAVVRNLALFIGCSRTDLTNYLARFTPEDN
jgi:transcriptional regulator with XRE-family HTH domain